MDPSDKKLSDGEKMTSRTVVGIGNLILAMTLTNHFVGNLTLSKSEVHALSLLSMAKICGISFMFIKTIYGCERFGSFVHLLSECF